LVPVLKLRYNACAEVLNQQITASPWSVASYSAGVVKP